MENWVLKGATAMLARLEGRARHTLDVDLYRRDGSLADAERALREAAVASARRFIDPVLAAAASGRWDPAAMAWRPRE